MYTLLKHEKKLIKPILKDLKRLMYTGLITDLQLKMNEFLLKELQFLKQIILYIF